MQIAITRGVSAGIGACELTHLEREAIDVARARAQHRAYEEALARAGCRVESLPALDDLPDSVFVEDVAIVLDEIAVITRPGAESRRPEAAHIAPVLARHRRVTFIQASRHARRRRRAAARPADLRRTVRPQRRERDRAAAHGRLAVRLYRDGRAGQRMPAPEVGQSPRSRPASSWSTRRGSTQRPSGRCRVIEIDPDEPYAANGLLVGGRLIYPASFPRTRQAPRSRRHRHRAVDVSELQKAEGAVTCCSLVFSNQPRPD